MSEKFNMDDYRRSMANITASDRFKERALAAMKETERRKKHPAVKIHRYVLTAAATAACVLLTVTLVNRNDRNIATTTAGDTSAVYEAAYENVDEFKEEETENALLTIETEEEVLEEEEAEEEEERAEEEIAESPEETVVTEVTVAGAEMVQTTTAAPEKTAAHKKTEKPAADREDKKPVLRDEAKAEQVTAAPAGEASPVTVSAAEEKKAAVPDSKTFAVSVPEETSVTPLFVYVDEPSSLVEEFSNDNAAANGGEAEADEEMAAGGEDALIMEESPEMTVTAESMVVISEEEKYSVIELAGLIDGGKVSVTESGGSGDSSILDRAASGSVISAILSAEGTAEKTSSAPAEYKYVVDIESDTGVYRFYIGTDRVTCRTADENGIIYISYANSATAAVCNDVLYNFR
ncbi:MAG: hypothetical protein J6F31_06955 [Oscillospiraceae bacterium]|nr:hypothetical protein [Oscillospiraceae bacterium]